jgi:hypothetical protein
MPASRRMVLCSFLFSDAYAPISIFGTAFFIVIIGVLEAGVNGLNNM